MGHVWVKAKVVNPLSGVEIDEEALVDTGATYTVIPWKTYEKLNLKIVGEKDVETAKGLTRLDESFAVVQIEGKRGLTPLLVSKDLKDLLIGVLTLEALGLTVDPTTGKLKETRILLLYCLLHLAHDETCPRASKVKNKMNQLKRAERDRPRDV